MHRTHHVLFAILASILLVTALPASVSGTGATNTATMQNTTDTDFNQGTLDDLVVEGTGTTADVKPGETIDGFEDNDLSEWSGDTADFTTSTTRVREGSYALEFPGDTDGADSIRRDFTARTPDTISYWMNDDVLAGNSNRPGVEYEDGTDTRGPSIYIDNGANFDAGSVTTYNGTAFVDTGIDVTADAWYEIRLTNIDYTADTFTVVVKDASGSTIGQSTGHEFANNIDELAGVEVISSKDKFWLDNFHSPGSGQGTYTSAAYDITNPDSAWTNLTLNRSSATVTWEYHDGTNWITHNRTQYVNVSANQTVDTSTQSADKWRTSVELTHFEHTLSSVWHFDDGSGTTASDSYGTRDATLQNDAAWNTTAKVGTHSIDLIEGGRGILGSGDSDYVSVPNKTSPRSEFTSGIWVYPRLDSTDRTIVGSSKSEDPDNVVLSRESTGAAGAFIPNVSSSRMEGGNLPLNEWSYVAISYNGTHEALYVKNKGGQLQQVNSRPANGNVTEFGDILIGRSDTGDTGNNFDGNVDHPVSHGRYLTLDELRYHVNNPTAYEGGTAELHDEGVEFTNHAPDASNIAPADGTTTEYEAVTFSADIDDTQFADAQGDTVTVDLVVDGTVRDTQTLTSTGTYSKTLTLADGSYNWHFELADDWGGSTTTSTRTLTVSHRPPELDNSSASPSGGETVNSADATLEINVSDEDFPDDGDTVTVEFYNAADDSLIGTDTRTSNGTASTTWSNLEGGQNSWYAVATDDYGYSDTSDTFTFNSPNTLYIRDEENASELVTENVEVTVRFFADDLVVQRNTTDGTVDMTGLPVDKEFIAYARVNNSAGWHDRRIIIRSLVEQQNIYLLNESTASVNTEFELEDRTSQFPASDSVVEIQSALDPEGDDTYDWHTVTGDYMGATGTMPSTLKYGERYRIVITNGQGDRRVLGTYIPTTDGKQILEIGEIKFPVENAEGRWTFTDDLSGDTLTVKFNDPDDLTENLDITVHERGNPNNELFTDTASGPLGEYQYKHVLNESEQDTTWVVDWTADRNGNTIGKPLTTGGYSVSIPMDEKWIGTTSFIFLTFIATLYGGRRSAVGGIVMVGIAGVLMLFQWVTIPPSMFAAAAGIAVFGVMRTSGGGL